jgi:hypothetical protein
MEKLMLKLINDEPVDCDGLGRSRIIDKLAAALKNCETPFVMAVNGGWGTGKTSILKCLEKTLKPGKSKKVRTLWFSPWKFQFEDSPAISLLQQIRDTAEKENWLSVDKMKRKTSKLLDIVCTLAGEIVLKTVTGNQVGTRDILNQGAAFEEKYFEAKQLTSHMQEEYQKAIEDLVGKQGRLIFFIDDLDRCLTKNALRLLEALKLFLNAKNCVYVIAIDMENLAINLKAESKVSNPVNYLEKIFQLVYTLPPPLPDFQHNLVVRLLQENNSTHFPEEAIIRIKHDLAGFLGHNPRSLKHFCNRFLLESSVIKEALGSEYNPVYHIFLQILQQCFPTFFRLFRSRCRILVNMKRKMKLDKFLLNWSHIFNKAAGRDPKTPYPYIEYQLFERYFDYMPALTLESPLEAPYLFVTVNPHKSADRGIVCLEAHERNKAIKTGVNLSEMDDLSGMVLRDLNLCHCLLDRCNFDKANLSGTDISHADCSGSTFKYALFKGGKARGTNFSRCDLSELSFQGADFSEANFSDAILAESLKESLKKSAESGKAEG